MKEVEEAARARYLQIAADEQREREVVERVRLAVAVDRKLRSESI